MWTECLPPQVGSATSEDGLQVFSNGARVWSDGPMGADFDGFRFEDTWLPELAKLTGGTNLSDMWNKLLAFEGPPPPAPKAYAAMFATDWDTIRGFGRERWATLHGFVVHGDERIAPGSTQKSRSVILEYMWAQCLSSVTRSVNPM